MIGGGLGRLGGLLLLAMMVATEPALAQPADADDSARIALIERVSASVVHVRAEPGPAPPSSPPAKTSRKGKDVDFEALLRRMEGRVPRHEEGSGFVVDSRRGLILTAAHIVARSKTLTVRLPDRTERAAQLVGIDEDSGFALLRVGGPQLPSLLLGDRDPRAGETALIVGWMIPLKSVMAVEGMVMGRAPGAGQARLAPLLADYVAIDAVIPNGGFGGSPVVDRNGAVIGFVSAIFGQGYGPGSVTLIIPVRGFQPLVEELAAHGRIRRGRLGLDVDCERLPCTVSSVEQHGPGQASGVAIGDSIVAVDGVRLESEPQLRRAVAATPIGDQITLTLGRSGRQWVVAVRPAAQP